MRVDDAPDIQRDAFARRRDMRRDRLAHHERRADLVRQRDVRGGIELIGVVVVQHAVALDRARRDRLHRGGAQARAREAVQQRGRDERLADFRIGSGDEER